MSSEISKTYVVSGFFLFTNGILTDEKSGKETKEKIESIILNEVHFHHNDSALQEKFITTTAEILAGGGMGIYALNEESKKKGNALSRGVGIAGIALLLLGLKDYAEIQERKNEHAKEIAEKIQGFCKKYPHAPFNLVLHSQGADVGQRALMQLGIEFQRRIRVITLGGMVAIPDGLCQYVINFKLNADPVPNVVGTPLNFITKFIDGQSRKTCQIWNKNSGVFAHGINEYLNHEVVQYVLRTLSDPDSYEVIDKKIVGHWNPSIELLEWEKSYSK